MNRRKAIVRITLAGAGLAAAFSGFKWHEITKAPDMSFLDNNKELITSLAETIIPATDTPGAKDAGVHEFIIKMIKDCTDLKTQNKFIDGLKDLQGYADSKYGKAYQKCTPGEMEAVLEHFERKAKPFNSITGKVTNRFLGRSFFTTLKEYTVEGYCTSRQGASQGLSYLFIPGRFEGCVTLTPGQKAWATN